jgi:hypothetical protein
MKKFLGIAGTLTMLLVASSAYAWHVEGRAFCDGTGLPLGGVSIQVTSTDGGGFTGTATTDDGGYYFVGLPESPACFQVSAVLGAGETALSPAGGSAAFCTTTSSFEIEQDFVISSPACSNEGCWLTGGGAKFSSITGTFLGQSNTLKASKMFNWGGNVNPGCSPTAGQGGQWNTIDALNKLHFHGTAIQVVRCGNVDGIPPGSTSPATPFNFIEFQGTGDVKGIQGNKANYPLVYFFGRAEDRNEPGSNGQRDGAGKDRYFLNVYTDPGDPVGTSIMLVDMDGDPSTVDPLIITDGNMQIHVSSCTSPALVQNSTSTSRLQPAGPRPAATTQLPATISFAAPMPNPAAERSILRYALPRDAAVSLTVYDVAGRTVRQLERGVSAAGQHSVTWDLRSEGGMPVSRGLYFLRLAVDGQVYTQSIAVMR